MSDGVTFIPPQGTQTVDCLVVGVGTGTTTQVLNCVVMAVGDTVSIAPNQMWVRGNSGVDIGWTYDGTNFTQPGTLSIIPIIKGTGTLLTTFVPGTVSVTALTSVGSTVPSVSVSFASP